VLGQLRPRERIELTTAPEYGAGTEFRVLDDLGEVACRTWLDEHVRRYQEKVQEATSVQKINDLHTKFAARFDDQIFDVVAALDLCSGKDLLTALGPSIRWSGSPRAWDAAQLREFLARWVADHTDEALRFLPEWNAFREMLRS
jgi:hypothetical protein